MRRRARRRQDHRAARGSAAVGWRDRSGTRLARATGDQARAGSRARGAGDRPPLGQRRICALRRDPLRALRAWLDELGDDHPSEAALAGYQAAIAAEASAPTSLVRLQRRFASSPAAVWEAWTSASLVRQWWAAHHFEVADCTVDARPGGALRIVMREGDGTRYTAAGEFTVVDAPAHLVFALAPDGPDGTPLFSARPDVRLSPRDGGTQLNLTIRVEDASPAAAPALAGLRPGCYQLFDKLAAVLDG